MSQMWPAHYAPPRPCATGGDVLRYVARAFETTLPELIGTNRNAALVRARAAAVAILVRRGNGYAGTGRLMHRDHTTIIHSVRRYPDYIKADPFIAVVVDRFFLEFAQ